MKIAVSACLLGEKIRYDGGHKYDRFITDELGVYVSYLPFCPENLAYGTPRPSIRLLQTLGGYRVHTNQDARDVTESLQEANRQELSRLKNETLCGIIFKSKSPSCGLNSCKVYLENGFCEGKDDGLFAALCREHFPLLPMEEEERLQNPLLREHFVMQLFAYARFEAFKTSSPAMGDLVRFHTLHKFLLQAKNETLYRELGNIVANRSALPLHTVLSLYEVGFKSAIAKKSSIRRNRNVLEHMAGFFKEHLSTSEKSILHKHIRDYADTIVPLIVPLSTIRLYAQKYETAYLLEQAFLDPYPKALALRSHLESGK